MSRNEEMPKTERGWTENQATTKWKQILFMYFICKLWRLNQLSYIIINTQKKQQKCIENENEQKKRTTTTTTKSLIWKKSSYEVIHTLEKGRQMFGLTCTIAALLSTPTARFFLSNMQTVCVIDVWLQLFGIPTSPKQQNSN